MNRTYYFQKNSDSSFDKNRNRSANIIDHTIFNFVTCIDNADPLRLGRIRGVSPFGEGVGASKNNDPTISDGKLDSLGNPVVPWSSDDPYLYNSLLPYQLNIVPMIGELVNVFSQSSPQNTANKVYIGPIISHPSKVQMDKWTNALLMTGAGKYNVKGNPYLKGSTTSDVPLEPEIKKRGVFANPEDIAIVGRYNTDIILGMRENSMPNGDNTAPESWYPQILIRSGKFKKVSNDDVPNRNPKSTFIQLNTFPTTTEAQTVKKKVPESNDDYLRVVIVYHLNGASLVAPGSNISGWVRAYSLVGEGTGADGSLMACSYDNNIDITGVTMNPANTFFVNSTFSGKSVRQAASHIEKFISYIDRGKWQKLQDMLDTTINPPDRISSRPGMTHPLYFRPDRPTLDLMTKNEPTGGVPSFALRKTTANEIKQKITLNGILTEGYGLAITPEAGDRECKTEMVDKETFEIVEGLPGQQGIVSIGSEKIYLLSHNTSDLGKISLEKNYYGISQKMYASDVELQTNSLVRGEKLMELLQKMANFLGSHTHSFPGRASCKQAHDGTRIEDIDTLIQDASKSILNKNIRIN